MINSLATGDTKRCAAVNSRNAVKPILFGRVLGETSRQAQRLMAKSTSNRRRASLGPLPGDDGPPRGGRTALSALPVREPKGDRRARLTGCPGLSSNTSGRALLSTGESPQKAADFLRKPSRRAFLEVTRSVSPTPLFDIEPLSPAQAQLGGRRIGALGVLAASNTARRPGRLEAWIQRPVPARESSVRRGRKSTSRPSPSC